MNDFQEKWGDGKRAEIGDTEVTEVAEVEGESRDTLTEDIRNSRLSQKLSKYLPIIHQIFSLIELNYDGNSTPLKNCLSEADVEDLRNNHNSTPPSPLALCPSVKRLLSRPQHKNQSRKRRH